jgi:hypothetical protein
MIESSGPAVAGRHDLRRESPACTPITCTADLNFLHGVAEDWSRNFNSKAAPEITPGEPATTARSLCQGRITTSRLWPGKGRETSRAGRKQMCKTSRRSGDECIAAAPDLWFEGLGFPHPVKPAKDPIRGANLIGSRVRQGCRGGAGLAPETAVVTKTRLHACPGKVGPVFR